MSDDALIGRAPCGCLRCAAVISSPNQTDTERKRYRNHAAMIARDCLKRGYRIEQVTNDYVRTTQWRCELHQHQAFKESTRV